ncbi:MAG: hypothetical protein ACK4YF_04750, partial [Exilispira sp.]
FKNKILFISYENNNFGDSLLKEYYVKKLNIKMEEIIFLNKKRKVLSLFNILFNIDKIDKVYFIGGIFQDRSSIKSFIYYFLILLISVISGKKIFILSCTFEIKRILLRILFLYILNISINKNLIDAIETRDYKSFEFINKLNCNKKLIKDPFDLRYKRLKIILNLSENIIKDNINKRQNENFIAKIIELFNCKYYSVLVLSINKSYSTKWKQKFLKELIYLTRVNRIKVIFLISDPEDYDFLIKLMKNKIDNYHFFRLSKNSINSLIKLLKNYEKKMMLTDRLHCFLILKKIFDIIIIGSSKIEDYINTWYKLKFFDDNLKI